MQPSAKAELDRLTAADTGTQPWRQWGPYLAERAWGTVREDYSESGASWDFFPFEHSHLRAYRWNEDGLGGICDDEQRFCFAFAFWNGADPVLKERLFGLTGPEGNHGEDAKEQWWYLDSTPTHSYMRWRYHYPQAEFPYAHLRDANREAGRERPEVELADTDVLAQGYWAIDVEYAKGAPDDLAMVVTVTNHGEAEATLDILPTLWFRNTWAWDDEHPAVPAIRASGNQLDATHAEIGRLVLTGDGEPTALACDNESNAQRLWQLGGRSKYPKDGINDHVVTGADSVNPDGVGTKAALRYRLTVPAGGSTQVRLRLGLSAAATDEHPPAPDLGAGLHAVTQRRKAEADAYFAALTPASASPAEADVLRQAVAGLLWSKQYYHYCVGRWLVGDPGATPPPAARRDGRNARWTHLRAHDVILMPDKWEYPWFAAWDLAFHCVALAHVDPGLAKAQIELLLSDRYQHPDGQLPAYEWAFDDVNPPVHAWAALQVFLRDGGTDRSFLARVLPGLERNFQWWLAHKAVGDRPVFGGGFLGLDNVGPFDRTWPPEHAGALIQSDGTAWMAMFAMQLAEISSILGDPAAAPRSRWHLPRRGWRPRRRLNGQARRHREQAEQIIAAAYEQGLWDDSTRFFYDVLVQPDGSIRPVPVRSVVGLLPLCAVSSATGATMVDADRLAPMLHRLLDEAEFLSPYGIRSLSAAHRDDLVRIEIDGHEYTVGYEPAESRSSTFGGNSNWRGPVWFPVNVLLIDALREHDRLTGGSFAFPTNSGAPLNLGAIADGLSRRLVSLFLPAEDGARPSDLGGAPDAILFHEYFHGDTGAGLGASHQTGWTAMVIELLLTQP